MDLRVLGPLEAVGPDGPVALKGLRQRAVLAVLVIEAGRVVSSDQLADLVWDGTPPDQAPASLQAYISKLRRALEPDRDGRGKPWQLLVTRAPGYVLEIDPMAVDARRFERTVDDAAGRLAAGDAAAALALLDEGLATWRGDPYADFTFSGFARNEINRLHELRWRAVEDRAEALLLLGRHRDVAAELDSLVAQAPLRERLRGQLMLALYRSGRQADALACFGEGRAVLVEELGLDPGPELRRLEQAILEQSDALDWHDDAPMAAAAAPPAGAPAATVATDGAAPSGSPRRTGSDDQPTDGRRAAVAPGRPAMVGRDDELTAVVDTVRAARDGDGSFTLVVGEAGIGKTRLLEEVAACAAADGVRTVWGRCPELEGVPPFWPWVQVLRALAADAGPDHPTPDPVLGALVPELVPGGDGRTDALAADSDAGRFRLFDAVARFVLAEAARRPVLVLLEDLHWADAASLRLLRFLAPQLAAGRLAVVATTRDREGSDALDELRADTARVASARRISLHGLDRDAIRDLTTRLAGSPVGAAVLDTLAERSAGNPFFLGELIRLGEAGDAGVPAGVRDVIQRRVAQLDEQARDLLTLASCCPGDAEIALLAPVVGRGPLAVLDDVDAALAARLVVEVPEHPGAIRFSHPLVRDAVYGDLSAARRAYLHAALGRELERRVLATGTPRPDDERIAALAHHFVAGAAAGTRVEAVRWSLAAGEQDLARWAADEAHRHFETALELARAEPAAGEAAEIDALIGAGRARRFLGDNGGRDAIDAALTLARKLGDPVRTVRAAVATGFDAWGLGAAFGTVDPELRAALEWALPLLELDDAELRVLGRTILAGELVFAEDRTEAPRLAAEALVEARALGRPEPLAAALMARWIAVWGPDSVDERVGLLEELEALVDADVVDPARWLLLQWTQALELVDTDELDAVLTRTDALSADGNHPALELLGAWRRSLRTILDGRFAEAEALIGAAHELAARANPREAFDASGGQLTLLYWQWGRLGELAPFLAAAVEEQPYLRTAFGPASALSWAQAGDHDEARAVVASMGIDGLDAPPTPMLRSGTTTTLAATAVELGDRELAEVALRFLGDHPGSPAVIDHVGTFYLGARAGFRGALLLLLDRLDEAVDELESARALNEQMGAVVFRLRNELDLADALARRRGDGDAERSVALLDGAERCAAQLGIASDVERAQALRAAAGGSAASPGPGGRNR